MCRRGPPPDLWTIAAKVARRDVFLEYLYTAGGMIFSAADGEPDHASNLIAVGIVKIVWRFMIFPAGASREAAPQK